jgi:hypoxanthine phosphoribosyltransferase
MTGNVDRILISRDDLAEMVGRLGAKITNDFKGKKVLMICVLKGAFIFLADLVRHINLPLEVDFMAVSSYGNNTDTSGVVRILKDLDSDITGKHVIIVEDIIDSGLTLRHLKELLSTRNPASISICTAFDKPDRRSTDVKVDYTGMVVPDEFVVGYGLDYAGDYRHLPDVCVLADNGGEKE